MQKIAQGLDLCSVARIQSLLNKQGQRLVARVLTSTEIVYFQAQPTPNQAAWLAKRFAAKEAVAKALGCGIGQMLSFQDVEIVPDAKGQPQAVLQEAAIARFGQPMVALSLTEEEGLAAASVVMLWL